MLCCDVCNSKVAALYCKANLAKLCLLCDNDIHSANALSLRHTRSQICDHCRAEVASLVCFSHNISLCQSCDRESHSYCLANRAPVQGFMGCPSTGELASLLGYDLGAENFIEKNDAPTDFLLDNHHKLMDLHDDLMMIPTAAAPRNSKDEVYEQLVEIRMRAAAEQVLDIEDAASISEFATQQQHTPNKSSTLLIMFPGKQVEDAPSQNNQSVDEAGTTPASEMHLNSNQGRLEVVMDIRTKGGHQNPTPRLNLTTDAMQDRSRYNNEDLEEENSKVQ